MLNHSTLDANKCLTGGTVQLDFSRSMLLAMERARGHVFLQLCTDIAIFSFIYDERNMVRSFLVHEMVIVTRFALKLSTCAAKGYSLL